MEYALKHVFGAKLHSWLASLASGTRPVRRHQGDSSQEDVLTRHRLRLFCEARSSVNNAVSVSGSHAANSSSGLRRRAGRKRINFDSWGGKRKFLVCGLNHFLFVWTYLAFSHLWDV